ncbi:MAG: hypothetical protein ACR2GL_05945, partial [Thermoleophilaceae bacterium]
AAAPPAPPAGAAEPPVPALPELGRVPWKPAADARLLRRRARIWFYWTLLYTLPFLAAALALMALEPLAFPVALASLAHAWITPELYAYRGASVLRPKGPRNASGEPVAQGLLGDLLDHDARELQRRTGLALERGQMGVWLIGESGALLLAPGSRRAHCFCVGASGRDLPPSDRIAHLLLALRTDERGFATVANHAFAGAAWRVRRRLPVGMRPAFDAARVALVPPQAHRPR